MKGQAKWVSQCKTKWAGISAGSSRHLWDYRWIRWGQMSVMWLGLGPFHCAAWLDSFGDLGHLAGSENAPNLLRASWKTIVPSTRFITGDLWSPTSWDCALCWWPLNWHFPPSFKQKEEKLAAEAQQGPHTVSVRSELIAKGGHYHGNPECGTICHHMTSFQTSLLDHVMTAELCCSQKWYWGDCCYKRWIIVHIQTFPLCSFESFHSQFLTCCVLMLTIWGILI